MPAPPATCNAPVVGLLEIVISLNINSPACIIDEPSVLETVKSVPVDVITT